MKYLFTDSVLLFFILTSIACQKNQSSQVNVNQSDSLFYKGADVSFLPAIENTSFQYLDASGKAVPLLQQLKMANVSLIRLRLWVNPTDSFANFQNMKRLHLQAQQMGFHTLLSVHYSDTWADPSAQSIPASWSQNNFQELKKQLYAYTAQLAAEFKPNYIQIGNEINNGFLWPIGSYSNKAQFVSLIDTAIQAVRLYSPSSKIVLHYAGHQYAGAFFSQFTHSDYDVIGLSYYPIWHGKSIDTLAINCNTLYQSFHKPILICETAYPFTLLWNDNTNNILGLNNQLLPGFSATPEGQKAYMETLVQQLKNNNHVIGVCYWGAEWVSFKGPLSTQGSSWENQAWFDFNNKALPVLNYKN